MKTGLASPAITMPAGSYTTNRDTTRKSSGIMELSALVPTAREGPFRAIMLTIAFQRALVAVMEGRMRSTFLGLGLALVCAACSDATEVVDTEHVRVDGHLIALHQLDAPSDAAACAGERELGAQARARLQALISDARDVTFRKTGMACLQVMTCDGFVQADGADVGQTLISEGLAARAVVPEGGEAPHDWCAGPPISE
jgi:endonuclease YncB( thermonuclease family)